MPGPEKFQAFTYKEDRDNPKKSSKNDNVIVGVKEENLIDIDDSYIPANSMDNFKYSSAKQNEWVRMLFQNKKTIDEIYKEIEIFSLRTNKPDSFEYDSKTRAYINTRTKEIFGSESPRIKNIINSSDAWTLKRGVESAFEAAIYIDKNMKEGGRIFTNDTLDAVNKIDFVQTNMGSDGLLDEINLIQVKSKKPLTDKELLDLKKIGNVSKEILESETVENIQKEHQKYYKNTEVITQNEIIKLYQLNFEKEKDRIFEKYKDDILEIMLNLSELDKDKKEKLGFNSIDEIIIENSINLTNEDFMNLLFIAKNNHYFNMIMSFSCGSDINSFDLNLFKEWIFNKSDMRDKEIKRSIYKENKPHNIISGRKFNSVIYYKENGGWGEIVLSID